MVIMRTNSSPKLKANILKTKRHSHPNLNASLRMTDLCIQSQINHTSKIVDHHILISLKHISLKKKIIYLMRVIMTFQSS